MTHSSLPPEDEFDQWLDDLAEGDRHRSDDDNAETAAYLQDHFGLQPARLPGLNRRRKAEIRDRVFASGSPSHRTPSPISDAPGIVAGPMPAIPAERHGRSWHIASIVAAAVLVLIAVATIGAVLRTDDAERVPGAAATASLMPFAPASALASPSPVASCTTTDTLLLMPEEHPEPGAFADLPFPVAWYQDGVLAVERQGNILREIEIGEADRLLPVSLPNIVFATTDDPSREGTLINITSGETFDVGPYESIRSARDWYMFWAPDETLATWHVVDMRTFEFVSLNELFDVTPLEPWTQNYSPMSTSDDGTVMLVRTSDIDTRYEAVPPTTPVTTGGPNLHVNHHALLINGSVDDISLIGPLAPTSSDMALSPDGSAMAWIAPSEIGGERTLMVADTVSGNIFSERSIEATYSNSLLFNRDGSVLYTTSGDTLESIAIDNAPATPKVQQTGTLPESGYRIVAASPDRTSVLLTRGVQGTGEVAVWLDLASGEMREFEASLGRMFVSRVPGVMSPIGEHVLLDDLESKVSILNMDTGEIVTTIDRGDGAAVTTISPDGSTLLIPHEDSMTLHDLETGTVTTYPAPDGAGGFSTRFALSSNDSCVAGTRGLESGDFETVLMFANSDTQMSLPSSAVGGWVPSGQQE